MRRLCALTTLAAGLLLGVAGVAQASQQQKTDFWLTVLHNNDSESALVNAGPGLENYGGVARFATLVERLKADATTGPIAAHHSGKSGVVMISSGDNFLPGANFSASLAKGVPYYDSIAMNLIGYDASTFGNHEFDLGPDVTAQFIAGFTPPVPFVSANLNVSGEPALQALVDTGQVAKSVVVKERGELIGIVGATTPLLPSITSPRNVVAVADVAGAVQEQVDGLSAAGIDKIILVSHLQSVNQDLTLIPRIHGVDLVIAGGGHELLAKSGTPTVPGDTIYNTYPMTTLDLTGHTIPLITTAGGYKYVGEFVAQFDKAGDLIGWDTAESGPKIVAGVGPDAVAPDPAVQSQVVDPVVLYTSAFAQHVLATSDVPLDGRKSAVRTRETNEGNLMADALRWQASQLLPTAPETAMQNSGGIRNDSVIPIGNITELTTYQIAAFSNFLAVVPNVTPTMFKALLENEVASEPAANGAFAQISGFSFVYDIAAPPQSRVVSATLDDGTAIVAGGVVAPGAPPVGIATNDFSAKGGDSYPFNGVPFMTLGVPYQQALANYITTGLAGHITAADYPAGGEGRITCVDGNGAALPNCP